MRRKRAKAQRAAAWEEAFSAMRASCEDACCIAEAAAAQREDEPPPPSLTTEPPGVVMVFVDPSSGPLGFVVGVSQGRPRAGYDSDDEEAAAEAMATPLPTTCVTLSAGAGIAPRTWRYKYCRSCASQTARARAGC